MTKYYIRIDNGQYSVCKESNGKHSTVSKGMDALIDAVIMTMGLVKTSNGLYLGLEREGR